MAWRPGGEFRNAVRVGTEKALSLVRIPNRGDRRDRCVGKTLSSQLSGDGDDSVHVAIPQISAVTVMQRSATTAIPALFSSSACSAVREESWLEVSAALSSRHIHCPVLPVGGVAASTRTRQKRSWIFLYGVLGPLYPLNRTAKAYFDPTFVST